jgi:hypothetical protein
MIAGARRVGSCLSMGAMALLLACCASAAGESTPGVGWKISPTAQPTNIMGATKGVYTVVVTNTGSVASSGSVKLTVVLPPGVTVGENFKEEFGAENLTYGWECPAAEGEPSVTCVRGAPVAPYAQTGVEGEQTGALQVGVDVSARSGEKLTTRFVVSGGGAPVAQASLSGVTGEPFPAFGFVDFNMQPFDLAGTPDTQAGDHPSALVTSFDVTQEAPRRGLSALGARSPQAIKDIEIDLPTGFGADPQAVARCTIIGVETESCPASSRVGTLFFNNGYGALSGAGVLPIYNVVPEHGYPAEFGMYDAQVKRTVMMYGSVRSGSDYGLHLSIPDTPAIVGVRNVVATLYGDPQKEDAAGNTSIPFFTNASECSGQPLVAKIEANTYEEPEHWIKAESVQQPVANCDLLQFNPSVSLIPSSTQADEPVGYTVDVHVPQHEDLSLEGLATPDLKSVTIGLPPGVTISPAAADGLAGCPGEGAGGFNLHSDAPGECPLASQVGLAEASTPVLPGPLHGHIYFAQPGCGGAGQSECTAADALNGTLYELYLELEGYGVVIKQAGSVAANPLTGQLTSTFANTPQQPVEDLKVVFKGGPRAPLTNPQRCGEALTTSDLVPSSAPETPDANPSSAYQVTGCEGSPFKPGFVAGTTTTNAGAFTDFRLGFSREDREQDLSQISLHTPPGLLGMLSSVPLCGEPQAQQGTCPAASEIGTTSVAVGAGSHPLWVQGGRIYLTGPYGGQPFGLSVVVPAAAGPFNLGTVVLRGSIAIDPITAALTIVTEPFPRILDGVPLRIRQVQVSVDRPGFMFNPTNCSQLQVTATLQSTEGVSAQVFTPFAAGGCKDLPFKPSFTASTQGKTSRENGASLYVKVTASPGEANIAKVKVELPKRLPARLTTLQQACRDTVFDANPAACPATSLVGVARARTPLLSSQLAGPAYFVSHGGAKFPELVVILQGEGVRVDLNGETFIDKAGVTSSTFATVPDVPVGSFELELPEGPYSALGTTANLCKSTLTMPTEFVAQNGAVLHQSTKVAATGCAKAAHVARRKTQTHKTRHRHKKSG